MTQTRNVLVTGGAGYVGSHTCKALSRSKYLPIVYDNLSRGNAWAVKWGPLVQGDLYDTRLLTATLRNVAPCAVLHFAAYAYVGESVSNALLYYRNNVGGTLSLIEAMQETGVDRLVFSSTCATYGEPDVPAISENHPQNPINPYGQSKLMVERILSDLSAAGKMKYIALRYFNAAGADPEGEIGEAHDPETHLIPLAVKAGLTGGQLNLFGAENPTPDGSAIRDYTHVADLATAHIMALAYLEAGKPSDCFNLGSGSGHSIFQVLETLRELGINPQSVIRPRRVGDPPRLVADNAKAKMVLGWKPVHSDLKEILSTEIKW